VQLILTFGTRDLHDLLTSGGPQKVDHHTQMQGRNPAANSMFQGRQAGPAGLLPIPMCGVLDPVVITCSSRLMDSSSALGVLGQKSEPGCRQEAARLDDNMASERALKADFRDIV
jgi:hypothetical protein